MINLLTIDQKISLIIVFLLCLWTVYTLAEYNIWLGMIGYFTVPLIYANSLGIWIAIAVNLLRKNWTKR